MQANASRWIYAAIIYFCLAIGLGVYMGASHDHSLMTVHAHTNLLGWVTMALIGLIYHVFPRAAASMAATLQFWLHNLALPVMMLALSCLMKGEARAEPVIGISSIAVLVSVLVFAGNILWRRA